MDANEIKKVVAEGSVLSCSGAIHACKKSNLRLELNANSGIYELKGKLHKDETALFKNLCPSLGCDYNQLIQFVFNSKPNTPLGHVKKTFVAQSTNFDRNYRASSGGLVKEVLLDLLENKEIDSAISVMKTGPLVHEPRIITTADEIESMPTSIYHMLDYTKMIPLLENQNHKKMALVCVPWQLDDVYPYISKMRPELKSKIVITIGLLFGWYFTHKSIDALCCYYNINKNELDDIQYRGKGRVGKIRFIFRDGKVKEYPRFNSQSKAASERYYTTKGFLTYVNTHNMLADIVVGDDHTVEGSLSKTGTNLVVVRTERGMVTINSMIANQRIKAIPVENDKLVESQKRERLYGDMAYSYSQFLRDIGEFGPVYQVPNKKYALQLNKSLLRKFHHKYQQRYKMQIAVKIYPYIIHKEN